MIYGSASQVVELTGVRAADLGVSEEDLTTALNRWLGQIRVLIDLDRGRTFAPSDPAYPLVEQVAVRMAANMVGHAQLRRETRVIRVDDWTVRVVPDVVMSSDVKSDLRRIPRRRRFRIAAVGGSSNV